MISGSKMKARRSETLDEIVREIAERQFEVLEEIIKDGEAEYILTRKIVLKRNIINQISNGLLMQYGTGWRKIKKKVIRKSQTVLESKLKKEKWQIKYSLWTITLIPIS